MRYSLHCQLGVVLFPRNFGLNALRMAIVARSFQDLSKEGHVQTNSRRCDGFTIWQQATFSCCLVLLVSLDEHCLLTLDHLL